MNKGICDDRYLVSGVTYMVATPGLPTTYRHATWTYPRWGLLPPVLTLDHSSGVDYQNDLYFLLLFPFVPGMTAGEALSRYGWTGWVYNCISNTSDHATFFDPYTGNMITVDRTLSSPITFADAAVKQAANYALYDFTGLLAYTDPIGGQPLNKFGYFDIWTDSTGTTQQTPGQFAFGGIGYTALKSDGFGNAVDAQRCLGTNTIYVPLHDTPNGWINTWPFHELDYYTGDGGYVSYPTLVWSRSIIFADCHWFLEKDFTTAAGQFSIHSAYEAYCGVPYGGGGCSNLTISTSDIINLEALTDGEYVWLRPGACP